MLVFTLFLWAGPEKNEVMVKCFSPFFHAVGNPPSDCIIESTFEGGDVGSPPSGVFRSSHCLTCAATGEAATALWRPRRMEIDARNIVFLFDGDTIGEHELLGLAGPSSTFPCPTCTVSKAQFEHSAGIHSLPCVGSSGPLKTVDTSTMAFRTLEQLENSHMEFMARSADERKRAGASAECGGAVRPCLPRTEIAGNVVPPVLHIKMTAVTKAANLLRDACRRRDRDGKSSACSDALAALNEKYSIRRHSRFKTLLGGSATAVVRHWRDFTDIIAERKVVGGVEVVVGDDEHKFLQQTFFDLKEIEELMMRPKPLCEHELDDLQSYVTDLAILWHGRLPDSVTPKLHMLFIDVPRFARLHGSVRHQCQCHFRRLPPPTHPPTPQHLPPVGSAPCW